MYLAYNSRIVGSIVNKFPDYQTLKLTKQGGTGKERFENIVKKIAKLPKTKSFFNLTSSNMTRKPCGSGTGSGSGGDENSDTSDERVGSADGLDPEKEEGCDPPEGAGDESDFTAANDAATTEDSDSFSD